MVGMPFGPKKPSPKKGPEGPDEVRPGPPNDSEDRKSTTDDNEDNESPPAKKAPKKKASSSGGSPVDKVALMGAIARRLGNGPPGAQQPFGGGGPVV